MHDDDLKAGLTTVEGEGPSPEFLASLRDRLEVERRAETPEDEVLPAYLSWEEEGAPQGVVPLVGPSALRRRWVGGGLVAAAAAVVVLVIGLLLAGGGEDRELTTTPGPDRFGVTVLPNAVVQPGDGPVDVEPSSLDPLDAVLGPEYRQERAAYEALGYGSGVAVELSLDVDVACVDEYPDRAGCRDPRGLSAAHRFPDAAGAEGAIDLLAEHYASHTAGVWDLFHPLMDRQPLDVELGDRAEAFTLSQEDKEALVLVWRNGNIVHVVWDLHVMGSPDRVDAAVALARAVDERMAEAGS